jgi:hypothetical protein
VDDAALVRAAQPVEQRQEQPHGEARVELALAREEHRERFALDELHHQERLAERRGAMIEDAHDGRVTEDGGRLRLASHA